MHNAITNYFKKLISKLFYLPKYLIVKLISLLFIKLTFTTSENQTSEKTFVELFENIINPSRIDFLSRCLNLNSRREIIMGVGNHVCYKDYLFFVKLEHSQPLQKSVNTHSRINGFWEESVLMREVDVVKTLDIYIPFWRLTAIKNTLKELEPDYTDPFFYYIVSWEPKECVRKINVQDMSKFDQEDVIKFENKFDEVFSEPDNVIPSRIISIESINNYKLVEHIANKKGLNVFYFSEFSASRCRPSDLLILFEKFIEVNANNPFIFYVDCEYNHSRMHSMCSRMPWYDDLFETGLFNFASNGAKYVMIFDQSGANKIEDIENEIYPSDQDLWWIYRGLDEYDKIKASSTKIIVGENNAVSK